MGTVKIRYIGHKPLPYRVQKPVPFVSLSEYEGDAVFNPEGEIEENYADYLVGLGSFEYVEEEVKLKKGKSKINKDE